MTEASPDLQHKYQAAWAAVLYGMKGSGPHDADGVSQDEALEIAAEFFRDAGREAFAEKPALSWRDAETPLKALADELSALWWAESDALAEEDPPLPELDWRLVREYRFKGTVSLITEAHARAHRFRKVESRLVFTCGWKDGRG